MIIYLLRNVYYKFAISAICTVSF